MDNKKNENKNFDEKILNTLRELLIFQKDDKDTVKKRKFERIQKLRYIFSNHKDITNDDLKHFNYSNINYYLEPNYTREFYSKELNNVNKYINYYFSSFNYEDNLGLEKSQLKTLFNVLKASNEYNYNRYISINGGPGVGKSTIAGYIISNLLLQDFNNNHKFDLEQICNSLPNILITGFTIQSVNNLSEITTIKPDEKHYWIKHSNFRDEIDFLFYQLSIDFKTIFNFNDEFENEVYRFNFISKHLKIKWVKKSCSVFVEISSELFEHIQKSFLESFIKYFNWNNKLTFQDIKNTLQNKININKNIILAINEIIESQISNNLSFKSEQLFQFLTTLKYYYQNQKTQNTVQDCAQIINDIINLKIIDFNDDYFNYPIKKQIKQFKSIIKLVENKKTKLKFSSKNKIFKKILKINKEILDFYFKNLQNEIIDFFNKITSIFNNIEVANIFKDFNIDISKINSKQQEIFLMLFQNDFWNNDNSIPQFKKCFFELLFLIDEFTINFNRIQKQLDVTLRSENTFLFRHYQECLFIETIKSSEYEQNFQNYNLKIDKLKIIKPIFSSNIQKVNGFFLKIFNLFKHHFDFVIVDEASQLNVKYALFLETITNKCLFALGDEKQLEPVKNDDNEISNENLKDWRNLFENLNLQNFNDISNINKSYSSFLDYVNKKTNLISNLSQSYNLNVSLSKGLYLLEHFRCPEQIFNLFNEGFYSGDLFFKNPNNSECLISNCIDKNITCNDTSFIYITYDPEQQYWKSISDEKDGQNLKKEKNHINLYEIEIGFKFLIKNFNIFINHILKTKCDLSLLNDDQLNKISKGICFISLYKHQSLVFKYLIDFLNNNQNKFFENSDFKNFSEDKKINFKKLVEDDFDFKNLIEKIKTEIDQKFSKDEKVKFLKILSLLKVGTIDALQGIGCEFVIFSIAALKCSKFENDSKRINVLLSRVKKHFIQLINNKYWDNKTNNNFSKDELNTIAVRESIEKDWKEFGYSKILINLSEKCNDEINILDLNTWKELNQNLIENNFETVDQKINIIGRRGENVFNGILSDPDFKSLIKEKIFNDTQIIIDPNFKSKWMNKEKESKKPYDFELSDNNYEIFIDVKTTFKDKLNSNNIFMSKSEIDLSQSLKNESNKKHLIAKISDVSNYNLCFKDKSSLFFILKNLEFYLVEEKNEQNNKKYICVQLKDNNVEFKQEIIIRK